jgi:peptidoglycan/LPS O-acetylase OafA/YrhL
MHPTADTYLAFVLFLPWFLVLGLLYCLFPRQPRGFGRLLADLLAVVLAATISLAGTAWAHGLADTSHGPLWRQLLATVVGYALFLLGLLCAFLLRAWLLRRKPPH